jgi:hypothetical protein
MSTKSVLAWHCDRPGCGHDWLSKEKPKRCARCKSPAWDKVGSASLAQTVEQPACIGNVEGSIPSRGSNNEMAAEARSNRCPTCNKPTIEWGAMRRCGNCNRNY